MFKTPLLAAVLMAGVTVPALAAPEKYTIDPTHTYPSLEFSHMGISVWRGKFDKTSGSITLDRAAKTGSVDVVIDIDSINFGLDSMHEHAIDPDWFDVAKYPTATYKGAIKFKGDAPKTIEGTITLRGQTKPVNLKINSFKCMPHLMLKKEVCGADATGELNWAEYGMKNSKYGEGEAGKVLLRIQVEGIKQD